MSQKNKKIALYRFFIVVLSVLAVIVLLAAIYLFVTYKQDKEDSNEQTNAETTQQTTTGEIETTTEVTSTSEETSADMETTQSNESETTSTDDNLEGADKALKIATDAIIEAYGENYKDTYYIEDIGLNNNRYIYCLRRSEDTYAVKWYYVDAETYDLTVE